MEHRVTQLTKTSNGDIIESSDMYPDMLNGGDDFDLFDDLVYWLKSDLGYQENKNTAEFYGWGLVMQHEESGEIINVTEK